MMLTSGTNAATATDEHPKRLKVLLSAFGCAPGQGSENGTGWWAVEYLSEKHDLTVMVAPMFQASIEDQLKMRPMQNVRWAFTDLPRWVIGKGYLRRSLPRVYYSLWQMLSLGAARRLHRETKFDVAHHITYGCYWRPSVLAYLGVPYVWGPVGGAQRVSRAFLATMSWRPRTFAIAKILAESGAITFDPAVKATARRAAIAVPTTAIGAERIVQLGAKKIRVLPQISLPEAEIEQLGKMPIRENANPFRLISLGRLLGWKGIHLALQAFADFHREYPASEYIHVGDGTMADELRRTAHKLGVSDSFKIIEGGQPAAGVRFPGRK